MAGNDGRFGWPATHKLRLAGPPCSRHGARAVLFRLDDQRGTDPNPSRSTNATGSREWTWGDPFSSQTSNSPRSSSSPRGPRSNAEGRPLNVALHQRIRIEENRFGFEPEITAKVARLRVPRYEVGISYYGRTYEEGKKIGWRDGFRALWAIVKYNLLR